MSWFVEGLTYVLSTVGALLPIVNPLSAVGLVMSITADLTEQERNEQIGRACIYMFWILTAFLVAGGMIVSYLGFRMLFPESAAISGQERAEARAKADISFTPLAMPSLSGPGSIAVVIGMSTTVQMSQHIVVGYVLVAIGIAITALISYIVLRASTRLDKVLGATGMNAMARIMGFLLICIGIQFVINGVTGVVRS